MEAEIRDQWYGAATASPTSVRCLYKPRRKIFYIHSFTEYIDYDILVFDYHNNNNNHHVWRSSTSSG